jgi:cell division protein FtsI/penicillin-binding protein 2
VTGRRTPARRPIAGNVAQVGSALVLAFGVLAAGAGYWQLVRSNDLSTSPDDPAVIAAAREAPRGLIRDRHGTVLASNRKDANAAPSRVYPEKPMTPAIGYASGLALPASSGPTTLS